MSLEEGEEHSLKKYTIEQAFEKIGGFSNEWIYWSIYRYEALYSQFDINIRVRDWGYSVSSSVFFGIAPSIYVQQSYYRIFRTL